MISKKHSQHLFILIMAFGMSVIMSGVVTAVNTGIGEGFIDRYFTSWTFALPIAVVAAFVMGPVARILVSIITSK
jgi:hypothetical protein